MPCWRICGRITPHGSLRHAASRVVFAPEAQADLIALYDYIADEGGLDRALAYTEKIDAACRRLATFPQRARQRDDIRPGLLITSIARRVTMAFHIAGETVTIDRIFAAGRDVRAALGEG